MNQSEQTRLSTASVFFIICVWIRRISHQTLCISSYLVSGLHLIIASYHARVGRRYGAIMVVRRDTLFLGMNGRSALCSIVDLAAGRRTTARL